jgi:hypothetical protein
MQVALNNRGIDIINGLDSVVIVDNFQSIRGGRSLDTTGFLPPVIKAGHVIIIETATSEYKPMPASLDAVSGVATFGSVTAGTGYANGTYENVPMSGGSGTGALATVVVASTVVSSVTKTYGGNGYVAGDVLTANNTYIGGTGTGFSIPVATVSNQAGTYASLPSGHTYAGINIASILTVKPFAGIMVRGTVNQNAAPYSMTSILSAVRTALPLIDFRTD